MIKFLDPSSSASHNRDFKLGSSVKNSEAVSFLMDELEKRPIIPAVEETDKPVLSISNLINDIEAETNYISFDYKVTGNTDSQVLVYYIGDDKYSKEGLEAIGAQFEAAGNHVNIMIPGSVTNGKKFAVKLSAEKYVEKHNMLISKSGRKFSQSLVSAKPLKSKVAYEIKETVGTLIREEKFDLTLMKVDSAKLNGGNVNEGLEGAVFTLKNYDGSIVAANKKTGADGKVKFDGLKEGAYLLTEVEAPKNYHKLTNEIKIIVEFDGTVRALVNGTMYSSNHQLLPIPNNMLAKPLPGLKLQ